MRIKRDGINFKLIEELDSLLWKKGCALEVALECLYDGYILFYEIYPQLKTLKYKLFRFVIWWKSMWEYKGLMIGSFEHTSLGRLQKFIDDRSYADLINESLKDTIRVIRANIEMMLSNRDHVHFLENNYKIDEIIIKNDKGQYEYWDFSNFEDAYTVAKKWGWYKSSKWIYAVCDWLMDAVGYIKYKFFRR